MYVAHVTFHMASFVFHGARGMGSGSERPGFKSWSGLYSPLICTVEADGEIDPGRAWLYLPGQGFPGCLEGRLRAASQHMPLGRGGRWQMSAKGFE